MKDITVLIGCFVVLLWGWRRVYLHIMRKDGRPLIAHMISFLLALFPARFFAFAVLAVYPPEGVEPVSDMKRFLLCGLFVLSVVGLFILTRKRNVQSEKPSELMENTDATENISIKETSEDKTIEATTSNELPDSPKTEDASGPILLENDKDPHLPSDRS